MRERDRRSVRHLYGVLAPLLIATTVLAGCGSSSSSTSSASQAPSTTSASATSASSSAATTSSGKPPYCASLGNLEASVKAIPSPSEVKKNGTNALKSAVSQVQTNATTVVNDAKSQFATQTSALKSSIDTLSATVKQMSSPPTGAQLKALPAQVSAVATATKDLKNSASPKCS